MCKRVGAKIFLRGPRDGKVLLRLQCICDSIFLVVNLILLNVIWPLPNSIFFIFFELASQQENVRNSLGLYDCIFKIRIESLSEDSTLLVRTNWKSQGTADLVTFTEQILNGKLLSFV